MEKSGKNAIFIRHFEMNSSGFWTLRIPQARETHIMWKGGKLESVPVFQYFTPGRARPFPNNCFNSDFWYYNPRRSYGSKVQNIMRIEEGKKNVDFL
jgi:hypothetical protein